MACRSSSVFFFAPSMRFTLPVMLRAIDPFLWRDPYGSCLTDCLWLQPNGNTLVTMGPQGILVEVTPDHEEVWRYISPVMIHDTVSTPSTVLIYPNAP